MDLSFARETSVDPLVRFLYGPRMQLRPNHPISSFLCAIVTLILCCTSASAQNNWLVLKNGQTIEGTVTLADGRYTVVTSNGSRIILAEDKVNFVADSISDIYWDKWSRVEPNDSTSHMSLFRWCLKNGLLEEAQKQIELVSKLDDMKDQSSQLLRMAQELELVVLRIEKEAQLAKQKEIDVLQIRELPKLPQDTIPQFAAAPSIPSSPIDAEGKPIRTLRPIADSSLSPSTPTDKVQLVDFEEDTQSVAKAERRSKPAWVNNRQLDVETRAFPSGTVSFYKRHLESKLISNCIQCHDSRSAKMPLSKRSFGQTIPRRMSQQNLHFVMENVNRSNPLTSSLLEMATTAHGQQLSPSFQPDDPYIFDLKKWTVAVSNDPAKWLMALSEESRSTPAAPNLTAPQAQAPAAILKDANKVADEIIEVVPEPAASVDPYDPAAFNRK